MSAEHVTLAHFDQTVGELKAMIASLSPAAGKLDTLTSAEVMTMLGYSRSDKFWIAVRSARVPFVRVTPRKAVFQRSAVEEWMKRKTRNAA